MSTDPNHPELGGRTVLAPGSAKNVITVGATSALNDESYTVGGSGGTCSSCYDCASCRYNQCDQQGDARRIADFSRYGYPNLRLKPDLVAPGNRAYGRASTTINLGTAPDQCAPSCNFNLTGKNPPEIAWWWGTSFSAPVVTGAAALVDDWFRVLGHPNPSPALLKASLIASATNLRSTTVCNADPPVLPAPDRYQGWGGVSLDRLFRATSNYYWFDQGLVFTCSLDPDECPAWTKNLTITDTSKPISVALVWTDRYSDTTIQSTANLVNDLDLTVSLLPGTGQYFIGNNYYIDPCESGRDGYSRYQPDPIVYDRKNNVERVDISAARIAQLGATSLSVAVNPAIIRANGIGCEPHPPLMCVLAQDFALFVVNAHE